MLCLKKVVVVRLTDAVADANAEEAVKMAW
jgi:hypothetical protein